MADGINTDKCFIMRVTLARKNIIQHQYTMNGSVLNMTNDIMYLGVVLNNKLQWDSQVNKMCLGSYAVTCMDAQPPSRNGPT